MKIERLRVDRGSEQNGRWLLCPSAPVCRVSRRYREGTLILETDFETDTGTARVIDFMPLRDGGGPQLVRIVEGLHGDVAMHMQFIARFDYGSLIPWVERTADGIRALGGPNALHPSTTHRRTGRTWRPWPTSPSAKGARALLADVVPVPR